MIKKIILIAGLALALLGCKSEDDSALRAQQRADAISNEKRDIAYYLSQHYNLYSNSLQSTLNNDNLSVSIADLVSDGQNPTLRSRVKQADETIRTLQGIEAFTDELLELRLADGTMLKDLQQGQLPLFAFEPKGNEQTWQFIEAFDIYGNTHQLDVYQLPSFPVFVVDNNSAKSLQAGLQAMRQELQKLGQQPINQSDDLLSTSQARNLNVSNKSESQPLSTTVLKKIRLEDDKEPWILGKAEIYALVTGVDPSRDKPTIDVVDMPYLDYDKIDYYPNQVMIHWSRYRWGAVDIVLMEQDSGTDYKELAKLLVEAAEKVLQSIPDLEAQGYSVIANITGKIIDAIPSGLLTNDDDFVDVFYTIQQDKPYIDHPGTTNNALVTLEPLTIYPTR
ncbi:MULTISPECIES: DUF3103 domain-containing protein [Vibrio]|uniref:DUF3103 domain-containing protein n=1 Tax=bacterium 19MO03SA05 TaxID=2920620 RepID=A0AAU6VAX2_UNCXX|nr:MULTISPECIES: DUF3103 domain-containing protein [Vibrio]EKO3567921.1 DUF3103 domain-containing protein [Vibrio metschnikovii]EKO3571001.1 DUF3103 domain-containing protein [Vibrio metschnikovii]EKO3579810.1 DUF3103 domain-containing protein [Vibrio metschnikovii]EKO3601622.1 DUF3103 domain-containing protein [Vibrio metschnikovii]EKO3612518.1 DUF3103 domain-containing protein [Vibrio metschnikovii]